MVEACKAVIHSRLHLLFHASFITWGYLNALRKEEKLKTPKVLRTMPVKDTLDFKISEIDPPYVPMYNLCLLIPNQQ